MGSANHKTGGMLRLQVFVPTALTDDVTAVFEDEPAVSNLAVMKGASMRPEGDLFLADVAREAANSVIDRLRDLGVHREGTIQVEQVNAWLSQAGLDAELQSPGSSADAVVWVDVTHRAYADSELNWTYLSFMTLATLIAGIAIVLDSQILVIGAMVLGPEFGAHRGAWRCVGSTAISPATGRRRHPDSWVRRRHCAHHDCRTDRPCTRVGHTAPGARTETRDGLYLHAGQMVVHRGRHCCRRGRFVADFRTSGRFVRSVHLGDDSPSRRQHCLGFGLWRVARGVGELVAAGSQPHGHGIGRMGHPRTSTTGLAALRAPSKVGEVLKTADPASDPCEDGSRTTLLKGL